MGRILNETRKVIAIKLQPLADQNNAVNRLFKNDVATSLFKSPNQVAALQSNGSF